MVLPQLEAWDQDPVMAAGAWQGMTTPSGKGLKDTSCALTSTRACVAWAQRDSGAGQSGPRLGM